MIDPDGTITTLAQVRSAEVKTNKLTITNQPVATSSAVLAATIGEGILPSGDTTVTILTKGITAKSKVFITAKSLTSQTLSVINLIDGASFEVATTLPSTTDTYFDWWIVESE
ncbi:hypothetical protein A3H85_01430 [Candidatus Daviesbacteria bacterium RIFCSPLOWO2_02_FULL_40_8]|nr:MAG: hypothetical protein A3H85_01430 [Candidatus Daviesbacteria bacterium RIFCSPLOWO2_02_FULL_40_8]